MNLSERRERFREILTGDRCIHPIVVFDPISARIAEALGFHVGFMPASIAAMTVLGAPDVGVLTLGELAEQVRRICRVSEISLMVDAEHGYGNALNVIRTVEELETAGVSALCVEDTALPVGFGAAKGKQQLVALEEGVGKIKAALAARKDANLVIVARTRALLIAGISEAIHRAKAYEKAGADAIFLGGIRTRQEIEAVHAETRLPIVLGLASVEVADQRFLGTHGVRIASQGQLALLASVRAVHETLKALREGKSPTDLKATLASPELMAEITRQSQYNDWIKRFLN